MSEKQETLKDLYDRKGLFEGLVAHPGWALFIAEALEQREIVLGTTLDTPCKGLDDALAQEFAKGRAYQLKMLGSVLPALIDNLTIEIQSILTQAGDEDGPGDDSSNDTDLSGTLGGNAP